MLHRRFGFALLGVSARHCPRAIIYPPLAHHTYLAHHGQHAQQEDTRIFSGTARRQVKSAAEMSPPALGEIRGSSVPSFVLSYIDRRKVHRSSNARECQHSSTSDRVPSYFEIGEGRSPLPGSLSWITTCICWYGSTRMPLRGRMRKASAARDGSRVNPLSLRPPIARRRRCCPAYLQGSPRLPTVCVAKVIDVNSAIPEQVL